MYPFSQKVFMIGNNDDYTTALERAIMSMEIHSLFFHKVLKVWIIFSLERAFALITAQYGK
jgi:hypothetical protein